MRLRLERTDRELFLSLPEDAEPASFALLEERTQVVSLRPLLARDGRRVSLGVVPGGAFRCVLRRESKEGPRALVSPWIHPRSATGDGWLLLRERESLEVELERCDPGLVVDAASSSGEALVHALLRTETGAPNQLVFLVLGDQVGFGRSSADGDDAARWIWRFLPCRDERDPAWQKNRAISRRAGRLAFVENVLCVENQAGHRDALHLDGEPIARRVTHAAPWRGGRLDVSPGRLALDLRATSRTTWPVVYVPPGTTWEGGVQGFGSAPAYESLVCERSEGWGHHRYVLLHSSVLIGSGGPSTCRLEGAGIRPVHAQLVRLGERCFVCSVSDDARVEVDGKRVRPRHLYPLGNGSRVVIGEAVFRFVSAHEVEMKGFHSHTDPGLAPLDQLSVAGLHRAQAALSAFRHSLCNELLNNLRGLASLWSSRATDESFRARFLAVLDRDVIDREIRKLVGTVMEGSSTLEDVLRELCRDLVRRAERLARGVERARRTLREARGADGEETRLVRRSDELLRSVQWLEDALSGRRVSIRVALGRARDVLLASAGAGVQAIAVSVDPALRDGVFGEANELHNAFTELLRNALRHGAGDEVTVNLEGLPGRRGGVRLTIANAGQGLSADRIAQFDSGSRVGSYGLVYVRSVIEEHHGGTFHMLPNERGGVTVTVELYRQASG